MSETAEDRAKRLDEWRKKNGKTPVFEKKKPLVKSGRYKTRLRPRTVRAPTQKKQTPRKRRRNENVCNLTNVHLIFYYYLPQGSELNGLTKYVQKTREFIGLH